MALRLHTIKIHLVSTLYLDMVLTFIPGITMCLQCPEDLIKLMSHPSPFCTGPKQQQEKT